MTDNQNESFKDQPSGEKNRSDVDASSFTSLTARESDESAVAGEAQTSPAPNSKEERKPVEGAIADWQDIGSAPKEEDIRFLASDRHGFMDVVWMLYSIDGEPTYWNGDVLTDDLTHWMPLPPAPSPNPDHPASVGENT